MPVRILLLFISILTQNQKPSSSEEKTGIEPAQTEPFPALSTDSIAEHHAEMPPLK